MSNANSFSTGVSFSKTKDGIQVVEYNDRGETRRVIRDHEAIADPFVDNVPEDFTA